MAQVTELSPCCQIHPATLKDSMRCGDFSLKTVLIKFCAMRKAEQFSLEIKQTIVLRWTMGTIRIEKTRTEQQQALQTCFRISEKRD